MALDTLLQNESWKRVISYSSRIADITPEGRITNIGAIQNEISNKLKAIFGRDDLEWRDAQYMLHVYIRMSHAAYNGFMNEIYRIPNTSNGVEYFNNIVRAFGAVGLQLPNNYSFGQEFYDVVIPSLKEAINIYPTISTYSQNSQVSQQSP